MALSFVVGTIASWKCRNATRVSHKPNHFVWANGRPDPSQKAEELSSRNKSRENGRCSDRLGEAPKLP